MDLSSEFGTTNKEIEAAERALGVVFPAVLKEVWLLANILEITLPGGWILHRIYDSRNPRKTTYRSIVHENTPEKGRWPSMPDDLIAIAADGTGDSLALRKNADGSLDVEVLVFIHDDLRMRKWGRPLEVTLEKAKTRIAQIERARKKAKR